jgi:hypothetical protein
MLAMAHPYAPFAVIVQLDTPIVSPAVNETLGKLRSEPDVPTSPCATQVVPAELVQMRQYPAVPVAAAAAEVIVDMVRTPEDTVPIVADIGRLARSVPVAASAQLAGGEPL